MRVYSVEDMKQRDQHTIHYQQETMLALVERAASAIYQELNEEIVPLVKDVTFIVICGKGRNGADGLALAKRLRSHGAIVKCLVTEPLEECSEEVRVLAEDLQDVQTWVDSICDTMDQRLASCDWVIDAIFGTGCKRPLTTRYMDLIDRINASDTPVISLDLPSGIHGDNGQVQGSAVHAEYTIVVHGWKPGNLLGSSCDYVGKMILTSPLELWEDHSSPHPMNRLMIQDQHLKPRSQAAHKYDFGKLAVIGGSRGMEGAAVLSAMAGLRTGCGLAAVLTQENTKPRLQRGFDELMVDTFTDKEDLMEKLKKTDAVVFGPGTLHHEGDVEWLYTVLQQDVPVVLDGGGILTLLELRDRIPLRKYRIIATPHAGEMARLFRVNAKEVLEDPLYFVTAFLESFQVDLILKGPCSILAVDGTRWLAYGPNSGMATAGSGDVLAGLLGGFLAQGLTNEEGMKLAILVHQQAGEKAKELYGERSMTASDLLANVYQGIRVLEQTTRKDVVR
jgi:NAD(P)H-hydrate epimerase